VETKSVLRHLLSDEESLGQYLSKGIATFDDIKRRTLLKERNENWSLPDHHYRLVVNKSFYKLSNIADILTKGVYRLSENLLTLKGLEIKVIPAKQHEWQDLITSMPPLLLQVVFLRKKNAIDWTDIKGVRSYYNNYLLPNFRYTALPSPAIMELDRLCYDTKGFHDLHMHLSGSTETDVAWQDCLMFPDKVYDEFSKKWPEGKVRELMEQESPLFTPLKFRTLLTVARRIRSYFYALVENKENIDPESLASLLGRLADEYTPMPGDNFHHPYENLIYGSQEHNNNLALEALMYHRFLDYISDNPENGSAELFHYYLLILGLCNRVLVQQKHQYGFEQFQKITLSGIREYTEFEYANRFHQIRGNKLDHLSFLEGRFSPKSSEGELTDFINSIVRGWKDMMGSDRALGKKSPGLQLVAHFIKKEEGKIRDPAIRHRLLRIDVWRRAVALALLVRKYERYGNLVTGVDAAASEFDAPPEVFAPAFRHLRRKGKMNHFTYHAGEDFHHIISGIRAIFEAVEFTGLQQRDRIGHAVACGLSPSLWLNAVGEKMLITQGEWLDNAIFLWHLSTTVEGAKLSHLREKLEGLIEFYGVRVYEESYPLNFLVQAWLYRKYEPMLLLADSYKIAYNQEVFDEDEWTAITQLRLPAETKELIQRYHDERFRKNYEKIIEVKSKAMLNASEIALCQRAMLLFMKNREIIIETLPTSNVRIGHHKTFKTYHLLEWLKWHDADDNIPPIVIGTDDTGIFATNIYNEYANIYQLLALKKKTVRYRVDTIKLLESNSLNYRFKYGYADILKDNP